MSDYQRDYRTEHRGAIKLARSWGISVGAARKHLGETFVDKRGPPPPRISNRRRDSKPYPIASICKSYELTFLLEAKITTTHEILARGASQKDRAALAAKTGIEPERILELVNTADLMRIKKVGPKHFAVLRAAGVRTLRELRCKNPGTLQDAILRVGLSTGLLQFPVPLSFVRNWIEQAKNMELIVTY